MISVRVASFVLGLKYRKVIFIGPFYLCHACGWDFCSCFVLEMIPIFFEIASYKAIVILHVTFLSALVKLLYFDRYHLKILNIVISEINSLRFVYNRLLFGSTY